VVRPRDMVHRRGNRTFNIFTGVFEMTDKLDEIKKHLEHYRDKYERFETFDNSSHDTGGSGYEYINGPARKALALLAEIQEQQNKAIETLKMGERPTWENGDPQGWDDLHEGWNSCIDYLASKNLLRVNGINASGRYGESTGYGLIHPDDDMNN